jgi:hypothetical protein
MTEPRGEAIAIRQHEDLHVLTVSQSLDLHTDPADDAEEDSNKNAVRLIGFLQYRAGRNSRRQKSSILDGGFPGEMICI